MGDRLAGKIAIVTGGASGIGEACVRRFAVEGAKVAILDLASQKSAAEAILKSLGPAAMFIVCDVTKAAECKAAIAKVEAQWGRATVLVNNAGISLTGNVDDMTEEDWDRTFDVNVKSVFLVSREVLPAMRAAGGGSIVNIASKSAFIGLPMNGAYCASKAAVVHLSRSMGVRFARDKVRVNALCPGTIDTPLYRGFLAQQPDPAAIERMLLDLHPLGLGTPDDIAAAALYLASDEARYVTGAPMLVDGGSTAQ